MKQLGLGLVALVLALTLCLAAGCGGKDKKAADGADAAESSTLTGKLDEVKDFMFTVTDDAGEAYVFSLKDGDKPQGLENVAAGDTVTVTYTGRSAAFWGSAKRRLRPVCPGDGHGCVRC